MRILIGLLAGSLAITSMVSHASDSLQLDKVKTGILPSGGFYSIYSVTCEDQSTSHIARKQRDRWCTGSDSQLECFRKASEASQMACAGMKVADSSTSPQPVDSFQ
jgi:hypothetical protein